MSWGSLTVSADRTHHVAGDRPAYDERFDEVLPFHAPGLAPVRRGGEAWHIDERGRAVYESRFLRTFGFYEGRAGVAGRDGWHHHITPDGHALSPDRYSWCGNFQGGRCTVRRADDRYLHIDLHGAPVSRTTWRYAGDYREGAAVVQADDGRSSHVDSSGELLHGRWFLDLDVFHKSFARARDGRGWHHVDRAGRALYDRRFAAVEPFYNGQARVEREDGGVEVIDESGATVVELRAALRSPVQALSGDLVGYWRTRTLAAAAELGVLDALPATAAEVAARCGVHPSKAPRLLRALAEIGTAERRDGTWYATACGALLRSDHESSLVGAALEYTTTLAAPWQDLVEALRSDVWTPTDPFTAVAGDAERARRHHEMLRSYARTDYCAVATAMGLRGDETIIDAGGGLGVIAENILGAHPAVRVVLLDRPEVIRQLELRHPHLEARAHDIFTPWGVKADAVVLGRVLHDWDDERALTVLRNARAALPAGGRVYVLEMVVDEDTPAGGLVDLHLLVVSGGKERTAREYAALFDRAGFGLESMVPLPSIPSLVVGAAR